MVAHRTRWLIGLGLCSAVATACSFGVDLDGLVGGTRSTPTNDATAPDAAPVVDATTPTDAAVPSGAAITAIGAGNNFACVLKQDGTVNCWGRGTEGRLGTGATTSSSAPVVVVNIDAATELSVGTNHTCVILANGSVECWGQNDSRQLGNGTTTQANAPTPVVGLPATPAVKHISAGGIFSCAHMADDTAMCWGDNTQGELGDGTMQPRTAPVAVQGVTGIKQLVTNNATACALVADGSVWCWGDNGNGELGSGTIGPDNGTATQIPTDKLSGVVALGTGNSAAHFCAVLGDGSMKCWGYGQGGNLGNAGSSDSGTPVNAATITDATSVALGSNFTCAIHKDASVSCWGANQFDTLAAGDDTNAPVNGASTPLPTTGLAGATSIAAGNTHACAIKDPHTVVCWGNDQYGALGRNRPLLVTTAVPVASTTDVAEVAIGREFGCLSRTDGSLACWGNNYFRQQARTDIELNGQPATVPNIANVAAVSAGDTHTCVVNADAGATLCWGEGDQGNLGNFGTPYMQATPVTFASGASADVGAGSSFSCALTKANQVFCAGYNADGRLGRTTTGSTATPGAVTFPAAGDAGPTTLGGVNQLSVGRESACAVYNSHTATACWGDNSDGQLGTGGGNRNYPANVTLPKPPSIVRVGSLHACAILATNELYCWGRNANGQLTGTNTASFILPQPVDLGTHTAKDVALGDAHTCVVLDDGTVECFGAGTQGQLGNGGVVDSAVPVVVNGVTGATAVRAAENHTCALTANGLMCWGEDYSGEVGVAAIMETGTPDIVQGL